MGSMWRSHALCCPAAGDHCTPCYAWRYCPLAIACLIIGATVSGVMPRSWQYLVWSQTESCFCPLLALQPRQQRVIFSLVIILASLMMCSQLAEALADSLCDKNSLPQYTQTLSLSRTSFSSDAGIFQLFAIIWFDAFTHNALRRGADFGVPLA